MPGGADWPACLRSPAGHPIRQPLPCNQLLDYDLLINGQGIADWAPHLLYPGAQRPNLVLRERLDQLLHGSCRKPHHPAADGLLCADRLLQGARSPKTAPPCW